MKNKKALGILSLVFFLFMFCSRVIVNSFASDDETEPEIKVETLEEKRFNQFKKALLSSSYFKDSTVEYDLEKVKAVVDGELDVLLKNGVYVMRVKDKREENEYCRIVDAIEMSLGSEEGESLETCKKTLDGSINMGGINVEFYDTYKILSVKANEKALLYDIDKSHIEGDLISVDEINYNVKIDGFLFSSMSTRFDVTSKNFNICGHVFDANKKNEKFEFSTYDENKTVLKKSEFIYDNKTSKYLSFCTEQEFDKDIVKYYSISKMGE